jgi:geranylgeranyl diphosphate synthase type I
MAASTSTSAAASLPAQLGVVAARVEDRIETLLAAEIDRWAKVEPSLVEPLGALRALVMAGGKRLRPVFCH